MSLAAKVVVNLFYPQVNALINLAYAEFNNDGTYDRLAQHFGRDKAMDVFFVRMEEYMFSEFRKHYIQTMFFPWTVLKNPELYERPCRERA